MDEDQVDLSAPTSLRIQNTTIRCDEPPFRLRDMPHQSLEIRLGGSTDLMDGINWEPPPSSPKLGDSTKETHVLDWGQGRLNPPQRSSMSTLLTTRSTSIPEASRSAWVASPDSTSTDATAASIAIRMSV